jgi:hypothetical protein
MLLSSHYKTQLLGRFGAFWRYSRGRGIVARLLGEILTIKTRDAGARNVRGGAGARVRVHVRVCARMCVRVYVRPPLSKSEGRV